MIIERRSEVCSARWRDNTSSIVYQENSAPFSTSQSRGGHFELHPKTYSSVDEHTSAALISPHQASAVGYSSCVGSGHGTLTIIQTNDYGGGLSRYIPK